MKRIILFLICFGCVVNAFTQEKNKYILGGDIGGFYSKNKVVQLNTSLKVDGVYDGLYSEIQVVDHINTHIQLTPNILFFISDKLLVGGGIEWLRNSEEYNSRIIPKTIHDMYLFYPAVRGYIFNKVFLQCQFDIGKRFSKRNSSLEIVSTVYGFTAATGYSIELGNIFVDGSLKYGIHKHSADFGTPNIHIGDYTNIQNSFLISLGIKYLKTKE